MGTSTSTSAGKTTQPPQPTFVEDEAKKAAAAPQSQLSFASIYPSMYSAASSAQQAPTIEQSPMAAPQAAAAAPSTAPAGVNNYSYRYADGTTGNTPWKQDGAGNYLKNSAGGFLEEGLFQGRTMPDGSVNGATLGNVTADGRVNTYDGYSSSANEWFSGANSNVFADRGATGANPAGQRAPDGFGYGTQAAGAGAAPQTGGAMTAPGAGSGGGGVAGGTGVASGTGSGGYTPQTGGAMPPPPAGGTGSYGGGGFGASGVPSPVDDASRRRVEQAILARLEPQFRQDEAAMQNKLLSAGLEVGSPAYNSELHRLQQGQNDARQQAILAGGTEESRQVGLNAALQGQGFSQGLQGAQFDNATRQQMLSELLLQRNTPLNELNSLRTGSQVAMPNFQGYYTSNAGAAPMFDAAQAQGNYDMAASQNRQSGFNSMLGGLATLGSAAIKFSDVRLKSNISRIGSTPSGVPLYSWDWEDGSGSDTGVLAHEVAHIPGAVLSDPSGYLKVDYSKIS